MRLVTYIRKVSVLFPHAERNKYTDRLAHIEKKPYLYNRFLQNPEKLDLKD